MPTSYHQLSITPQGKLKIVLCHDSNNTSAVITDLKLIKAFEISQEQGLMRLLAAKLDYQNNTVLTFWRDYFAEYIHELCRLPPNTTSPIAPIVHPEREQLEKWRLNLPPMRGAEYSSIDMLQSVWEDFDHWLRSQIATEGNVTTFLKKQLPMWHPVGRLCFHLAENKENQNFPFAFMATYTTTLNANNQPRHQPLNQALQEYAGNADKKMLSHLLQPIYQAAKHCLWLSELVASHDIYHPLAWSPSEAYQLLQSVPLLEENGIVVKLPNWWKKKAKPKVQITLGNAKKTSFNAAELLDFSVDLVLEGASLSNEERSQLLAAENGLIFLRGQWIELDKEKLQEALTHWESVQKSVGKEGISFIEGMRLLAGASQDLVPSQSHDELQEWYGIEASSALQRLIDDLRNPARMDSKALGSLLQAQLRPYQEIGVNWLDSLTQLGFGACLADDMGLGKTIQIIALLLLKKQRNIAAHPSLLVLPTSLLANWKAEVARFAPTLNITIVHSSSAEERCIKDSDLVITTYGMLLRQAWLVEQSWELVILDEAQAIKNPGSSQTKVAKKLKGTAKITLTGTPIENRLGDLWSLFDFICPGLLGSAMRFRDFIKALENKKTICYAPLRQLVQPYILRRLKTDKNIIQDLPDKSEVDVWCGLSKTQIHWYTQAVKEMTRALESTEQGIKRRGLVLAFLTKLKQICNHPSQLLMDKYFMEEDSGKFIRLREICEEIGSRQEKVLIFTQYREMTRPLSLFLASLFGREGLILHGGTSVKQRETVVKKFQEDEDSPFFILSLKAGGTGLNLTAANHVIHFDRWWNPAVENQATDRAFRIGQKKNVLVHKFICKGTVEEKIDKMIKEKKQLADDVLSIGGEALLTELNNEELLSLVALDIDKVLV